MAYMNKYSDWLLSIIDMDLNGYGYLQYALANKDFYSIIPEDERRDFDGRALRQDYDGDVEGTCSVLEMMVALAIRMADEIVPEVGNAGYFFWLMLKNLGLTEMDDARFNPEETHYILDRFLERGYSADGYGGLFPLEHPKKDQRNVEIWYQMQAYVIENYEI